MSCKDIQANLLKSLTNILPQQSSKWLVVLLDARNKEQKKDLVETEELSITDHRCALFTQLFLKLLKQANHKVNFVTNFKKRHFEVSWDFPSDDQNVFSSEIELVDFCEKKIDEKVFKEVMIIYSQRFKNHAGQLIDKFQSRCSKCDVNFHSSPVGLVMEKELGVHAAMEFYLAQRQKQIYDLYIRRHQVPNQENEPVTSQVQVDDSVSHLVKLCSTFELMSSLLIKNVSIDNKKLNGLPSGIKIMYNYARMCNIVSLYEEKVKSGFYSPANAFAVSDQLQQTILKEFEPVLKFLIQKPQNDLEPSLLISKMLNSADDVCRAFSKYYRTTQVLIDPIDHLMPAMYCRVEMIRCLKAYFEKLFLIIGVCAVSYM